MASILDKYGIKEVSDVTFYHIGANGKPDYPVLFLDTLKVSTIEQTGETSDARGGKGNSVLLSWDHSKELNVTLEDALFSPKSMAIMFGDGTVYKYATAEGDKTGNNEKGNYLMRTEEKVFYTGDELPKTFVHKGKVYNMLNPKYYTEDGAVFADTTGLKDGDRYFVTYDIAVDAQVIEISANSFPSTYYIVGETFARPQNGSDDQFFQFIIPRAKVQSENTITMEADGDPSVFNLSLKVLRGDEGEMMKLVKYDLLYSENVEETTPFSIVHNHVLNKVGEN